MIYIYFYQFKIKVYAGDELIAINDQIVVGWSLANVVTLLRSCRSCQAQCEGTCADYDATLLIKRSFVNAEYCRGGNRQTQLHFDSRSRSTPDVNHIANSTLQQHRPLQHHFQQQQQQHPQRAPTLTNQLLQSQSERRKPRLSLPPPPSEPYRPKRPQSMDISSQRAHSLGNLTGRFVFFN